MSKKAKLISVNLCIRYFDFDEQGNLYWKETRGGKFKGSCAGSINKQNGYRYVGIEEKLYKCHRILYQLFYNIDLKENEEIDHINGIKSDNRKENLRIVTRNENMMNRNAMKNNKLGIKNITIITNKKGKKYYYIYINKNNIRIYSECFIFDNYTLEEVIEIRDQKLKEIHGKFHNLG